MHKFFTVFLLIAFIPILQGCFPVIAGGVGAGVTLANERRTPGIYIEDQNLERKAQNMLSQKLNDQVHVNLTSYNLTLLLTGEAPNPMLRAEVESIVRAVPNVRQVFNEVAIAPLSTFSNRSNDSFLTTKVKARMVEANKFNIVHVKVVTEASVVYLLGIVTRKEAEVATEIARTTSGVGKVVRLFEYID